MNWRWNIKTVGSFELFVIQVLLIFGLEMRPAWLLLAALSCIKLELKE